MACDLTGREAGKVTPVKPLGVWAVERDFFPILWLREYYIELLPMLSGRRGGLMELFPLIMACG